MKKVVGGWINYKIYTQEMAKIRKRLRADPERRKAIDKVAKLVRSLKGV